jgi:hypothetical protein
MSSSAIKVSAALNTTEAKRFTSICGIAAANAATNFNESEESNVEESKELTVVAPETPAAPQHQLMTIEPTEYVAQVFEPFAKRYADGVDAVRGVAYDIKTTAGMAVAVKFRALFRAIRTESENARKLRKAPILEIGRLLDSRKGELEAVSLPLETMFDDEIKAEEQRKDAEKQAKAAIEKARIDAINAKIDEMRRTPASFALKTAAELKAEADRLSETVISLDEFAEFTGEAMQARNKAVEQLRELQESAEEMEARQARLAEERAQFAREREEAAERDRLAAAARAEEERKAREAREAEEARLRAEREAHEAELRRQREAEEARLRAEREAEESQLAAERAEFQRQQAEMAEQQRVLREATEKLARERREREEAAAAAAKVEADHGEALEENARIDAARAAAAEAARVDAQRQADEAERLRRERVQFAINGPGDAAIVELLTTHYGVSEFDVVGWIERFDSKPYDDKIQQQRAA